MERSGSTDTAAPLRLELLERDGTDEAPARIFGAVDALRASLNLEYSGTDAVWMGRDPTTASLRDRLGEARYRAAYDAGGAFTPERALEEAVRLLG